MSSSSPNGKRSLFSKSPWLPPETDDSPLSPKGGSIFGRSVEVEEILRAEKAERERKAARSKARHEAEANGEPPEAKRRKSSEQGPNGEFDSDSEMEYSWKKKVVKKERKTEKKDTEKDKAQEKKSAHRTPTKRKTSKDGPHSSPKTKSSSRRRSHRKSHRTKTTHGEKHEHAPEAKDDDLIMLTPTQPVKPPPQISPREGLLDESDSEEEDEYFRALKQKAREEAERERQSAQTVLRPSMPPAEGLSTTTLENAGPGGASGVQSQHDAPSAPCQSPQLTSQPRIENQQTVKLLVTSEIPNTKPLIFVYRASQALKLLKACWCQKFDLEPSEVFFLFRGTKMFDATTMGHFIEDKKGQQHHKDQPLQLQSLCVDMEDGTDKDDHGSASGSVQDPDVPCLMLEAATQKILDQKMQNQEGRPIDEDEGSDEDASSEDLEEDDNAIAIANGNGKDGLVLTLLQKIGNREVYMYPRVRPRTTIRKIMSQWAVKNQLDEKQTLMLFFNGTLLDKDKTVGEVGLEHEDQVDVKILSENPQLEPPLNNSEERI